MYVRMRYFFAPFEEINCQNYIKNFKKSKSCLIDDYSHPLLEKSKLGLVLNFCEQQHIQCSYQMDLCPIYCRLAQ